MVKTEHKNFLDYFEEILVRAWGSGGSKLNDRLIERTRLAIKETRKFYRFKTRFPTNTRYRAAKNRVGYIGSYGERHAYLPYAHLKFLEEEYKRYIPDPGDSRELNIIVLGAGAGLEVYGVCLFYNEIRQRIKKLNITAIDKIKEWNDVRRMVFHKLIKDIFPRIEIDPVDIESDLTKDCIGDFSKYYDRFSKTDILLIYNVLNEIEVNKAKMVFHNLKYFIKNSEHKLLIIIMEPVAARVAPRVNWVLQRLVELGLYLRTGKGNEREFKFVKPPIHIEYVPENGNLNSKLFSLDGRYKPKLENRLSRVHFAVFVDRLSPISAEDAEEQLTQLGTRGPKGRFVKRKEVVRTRLLPYESI